MRASEKEISYNEQVRKFMYGDSIDCYKFLGSRLSSKGSGESKANGVSFSVWAPSAQNVRVVGEFNYWGHESFISDAPERNLEGHMEKSEEGIWSCFIEGLSEGTTYKYEITSWAGERFLKSDPMCYSSELRPHTASVVYDLKNYRWTDKKWMESRAAVNYINSPVNIYELHLGSWRRGCIPGMTKEESERHAEDEPFLNYREIADELCEYVKEMGYTHVEIMPVCEHPLDASWGYQTLCYYSITSRYGKPDDLQYFVNKMHRNGIGVIFDWVPGHFCKDAPGLYCFDGTWLYENENNMKRENYQWGTANFDFRKGHVQSFLISNAMYFFKEFHADGLRVDAVTNILCYDYAKERCDALKNEYGGYENVAGIEFCRKLNRAIYTNVENPLMIAEESTAWPLVTKPDVVGGLGFTFKWNMGWMNDTLEYISLDPIYRKDHHNKMTFSMMYAFAENYVLPLSHDEVVHGKKSLLDKCFGNYDQKFKELKSYYTFMMGHPGKKLMFMGGEFGPFMEWRHYEQLEWKLLLYPNHANIREYVKALNKLYREEKAMWEIDDGYDGFEWINADDCWRNVFSFVRKSKDPDDFLMFVVNMCPVAYNDLPVGIPRFTEYREILCSDSYEFGGSGMTNENVSLKPLPSGADGKRFSIRINLASYGAVVLKPVFNKSKKAERSEESDK